MVIPMLSMFWNGKIRHQPQLLFAVFRLLYHISNIFRDNAPVVPAQPRLHIDRKRMQELQELRIALGPPARRP